MSVIDERILSMKFDNEQFEHGIKESMNSLNKFEKEVNSADSVTGMVALSKSVEGVSNKLSAMSVIGITALSRLTNAAITTGKKIASALTIDPMKSGFAEYQEQMDSTMVIMSNTGESLNTVTEALDELNIYADKTVYSFGQMTNAIGKFAAAGVGLDDSVAAIKGLSNAAALVGAQGPQLASAYYNLSQSLQMGYLQTIDYNSLANSTIFNKNMRDIMVETAIEMGKFTKDSEMATLATENFKDSLQKKWLTSDVILAALEKYSSTETEIGKKATAAATEVRSFKQMIDTILEAVGTGWADSWKIVVGDLEEAKALFTGINNVLTPLIDGMSKARLELLKGWKSLGGRDALIKSFYSTMFALQSIFKPIKKAFQTLFPPTTAKQLAIISNQILEFTRSIRLSEKEMKGLQNIVTIILIPLRIFANTLKVIVGVAGDIAGEIVKLIRSFVGFMGSFKNINEMLQAFKEKLIDIFGEDRYTRIMTAWQTITENLSKAVATLSAQWADFKDQIKNSKAINKLFGSISDGANTLGDGVLDIIVALFEKLAEVTSKIDLSKFNVFQILADTLNILASGANVIVSALGGLLGFTTDLTTGFINLASAGNLLNVIFGAVLAKSIWKMANGAAGFWKAFFGIGEIIDDLGDTIEGVKLSVKGFAFQEVATGIKNIAIAIGILALSLAVLNSLDTEKLVGTLSAFVTIAGTLFGLTAGFMTIAKVLTDAKNPIIKFINTLEMLMSLSAISMLITKITVSILAIAVAVKLLSTINPDQAISALLYLGAALAIMIKSAEYLSNNVSVMTKGTKALVDMALAVGILTLAVKGLGQMPFEQWIKGIVGMGAVLVILIGAAERLGSSTPQLTKGTSALIMMAAAVRILVPAIDQLGTMNIEQIVMGLGTMAGALIILLEIAKRMTGTAGQLIGGSGAILIMAVALRVLAPALESIGSLPFDQIMKGLIGIAGSLGLLIVGLKGFEEAPAKILAASAALLIASGSIAIMAGALAILSHIPFPELMTGMLGLVVPLVALSVALTVLGGIGPAILLAAGALALGSAAMLGLAAAIMILTPSLIALTELNAGDLIVTLLALSGGLLALGLVTGVLGIVSPLILAFSISLGALAIAIAILSPALLALSSIDMIAISQGLLALGGSAALAGVTGTLLGLAAIGVAAFSLALLSLSGAILVLEGVLAAAVGLNQLFEAGAGLILQFKEGIESKIEEIKEVASNLIAGFVNGIKEKIANNEIVNCAKELGGKFLKGLRNTLGIHSPSDETFEDGENTDQGLINGLKSKMKEIFDISKYIGTGVGENIDQGLQQNDPDLSGYLDQTIIQEALANEQYLLDSGADTANSFCDGMEMALNARGRTLTAAARSYMSNLSAAEAAQFFAENKMNEDYFATIEKGTTTTREATEATNELSTATGGSGGAGKAASEAKDEFDSMRDSIASSIDVFKEFTEAETVSGDRLMANLASQIRGTEQWASSFEQLAAKGFDEAIIKKLADMGTESYGYIKGMLSMSDSYIQAYNNMFRYTEQLADSAVEQIKIALPEITKTVSEESKKTESKVDSTGKKLESTIGDVEVALENVTDTIEDTNDATLILVNSSGDMAEVSMDEAEAIFEAAKAGEEKYAVFNNLEDAVKAVDEGTVNYTDNLEDQIAIQEKSITITKNMVLAYIEASAKMNEAMDEWKKDLKSSLESSLNLFEKFDFKSEKTAEDYSLALHTQLNGMEYFKNGIAELLARGFDPKLVNEIKEKGYDAGFEIIAGYLQATDEQKDDINETYQRITELQDDIPKQLAEQFKEAGYWTVEGFATGLTENQEQIKEAFDLISTYGLENFLSFWGIASPSEVMITNGQFMGEGLIIGMNNMRAQILNRAYTIAIETKSQFTKVLNYNNFFEIGQNIDRGLIDGINSMRAEVEAAARELAEAANNAFNVTLSIHSPSRVFERSGKYIDEGVALGIRRNVHMVVGAAEYLGDTSLDAMQSAIQSITNVINSDMDTQPVIRPVLDLSEIQNGSSKLDNMLAKSTYVSAQKASQAALSYEANRYTAGNVASTQAAQTGNTFNFTQNNYSPKALDRIAIYRQTNNQFSKMKGLVQGV